VRKSLAPLHASLVFFALLLTGAARAEAPSSVSGEARPTPPSHFHLDASTGVSTLGGYVGATALGRIGAARVGVTGGVSGLFSTKAGGGIVAGVGWHGIQHLSLDLLGEAGMQHHHAAGSFLSDDPGRSGNVPYLGVRLGLHAPGKDPGSGGGLRWTIGGYLALRQDLSSRTATYAYEGTGLLSGDSGSETRTVRIGGQTELTIAVALGFDLIPSSHSFDLAEHKEHKKPALAASPQR
jgi:hypothetical protein